MVTAVPARNNRSQLSRQAKQLWTGRMPPARGQDLGQQHRDERVWWFAFLDHVQIFEQRAGGRAVR
jgi:hypothetical protein